ncbi:MAG: murein L,D-transpeptidase family protein [Pseudorhodoplanes sp.]|nr:murein L,D-transpeptidase family protein [Pseudorhodoplanes sp.]
MKLSPNLVRTLMASAALAAAIMLSGCKTEGVFPSSARANAPISPALLAEMDQKNMDKSSPLLVRIFKQESELEVWKQDRSGRYALLKTYPICKWSGDLGPKIREGDRQAPEGFYNITPAQMNPNSQFYLAFNMGYPNVFDRAHGRTGAHLMVHGDCSSRGCYAMTNEQISEIFAMGREAFFGGQQSFQVQAYPFRMTPVNMAKHRNNPNMPFWKMLKQGYDHFEVTHLEPKVDVCEKRYVFNAAAPANASTPLSFSPAGKCPVFETPQEIWAAVNEKQRADELKIAELTSRGTPTAPIKSGRDGGMHPTFVAKLQPREIVDERGNVKLVVDPSAPGPVASSYSVASATERESDMTASTQAIRVADVPLPRNAPQAKQGVRPEEPSFAQRLGSLFRIGSSDKSEQSRVAAMQPAAEQPPKPAAKPSIVQRVLGLRGGANAAEAPTPKSRPARTAKPGAIEPQSAEARVKTAAAGESSPASTAAPAPATNSLMNGAQPMPSTSSFDSRWSAFR